MAVDSPFVGNLFSQTMYCLDVSRRLLNVGGVLNRAVARERLDDALQATDPQAHPVRAAALHGGLIARDLLQVVSVPYNFVVGTGRHRLAPGEPLENDVLLPPPLRPAWLNSSSAGPDVCPRYPLFYGSPSHRERMQYLNHRVEQHFGVDGHFGDMGLLGAAALWATVPVYTVSSAAGAVLGCALGTVAYGSMALMGRKPEDYGAFVSESAAMTGALSAAVMFGALTTAPAWLALQGLRALGAAAEGLVTVVGVILGAAVGLAQHAYQQRILQDGPAGPPPKDDEAAFTPEERATPAYAPSLLAEPYRVGPFEEAPRRPASAPVLHRGEESASETSSVVSRAKIAPSLSASIPSEAFAYPPEEPVIARSPAVASTPAALPPVTVSDRPRRVATPWPRDVASSAPASLHDV